MRLNFSAVHSPLHSTEGVSKLMREPVFNETLQLGIVVRDLDAPLPPPHPEPVAWGISERTP